VCHHISAGLYLKVQFSLLTENIKELRYCLLAQQIEAEYPTLE
jgi:hypothetical protein